jgi:hypothetical protein
MKTTTLDRYSSSIIEYQDWLHSLLDMLRHANERPRLALLVVTVSHDIARDVVAAWSNDGDAALANAIG